MILIIDNYDSFVYNIARYVEELGEAVEVKRNDAVDVAAISAKAIIISPGPCTPREAGCSLEVIRRHSGRLPILGVCLGHQAIGEAFGGAVTRAKRPLHGEASEIIHQGQGVFEGLPNRLLAARYHSLIVTDEDRAGELVVTARSDDGEVMGLQHRSHPTFGVQFHPESILTEHGHAMLANFLKAAA